MLQFFGIEKEMNICVSDNVFLGGTASDFWGEGTPQRINELIRQSRAGLV